MLGPGRYLLGIVELLLLCGFAWTGAAQLRRRLLPSFAGAPAILATRGSVPRRPDLGGGAPRNRLPLRPRPLHPLGSRVRVGPALRGSARRGHAGSGIGGDGWRRGGGPPRRGAICDREHRGGNRGDRTRRRRSPSLAAGHFAPSPRDQPRHRRRLHRPLRRRNPPAPEHRHDRLRLDLVPRPLRRRLLPVRQHDRPALHRARSSWPGSTRPTAKSSTRSGCWPSAATCSRHC